ncbi:MAG: efflux RND transporter periplasmic adaptor subunit [Chloroflexota bacterium]
MKKYTFVTLSLLLLLAVLVTACSGSTSEERVAQAAAPEQKEVEIGTPVEVAEVETGDIALIFSYAGNLQSKDEVSLMPAASGQIESVLVEVGDEVKVDDPLATIERDRYIEQVRQAQAALTTAKLNLAKMELGSRAEEIAAAQAAVQLARAALNDVATIDDNERTTAAANLAQAQSTLQAAQADYDKIAWAGDVGTTQEAQALEQATIAYENALAAYNLQTNPNDSTLAPLMAQLTQAELTLALIKQPFREIDFEIARTAIEQAESAVVLANLQLDDTTIKAPFDGVIAELYITEGSSVGPQSPVALQVSKEVEVSIEVEESRIGQIFKGQKASLQVTAYPGQTFPAEVTSVAPVADQDTRTFTVKITPVDAEGQLRSGMYANALLLIDEKKDTLLVSRDAVTTVNDHQIVYVVNGNTVEAREVTTGLVNDGQIEILTGLKQGETVVTAGQPNLTDGAKIEVVNRL